MTERERIFREARETLERPAPVAHLVTDAEIVRLVDERVAAALAVEREETDRRTDQRIAAAQCAFLQQVIGVLDDIDEALIKAEEKFGRVDEGQQRLRREIAEVRTLANAENATVIDGMPVLPRRAN
jgi:hypothetical protein